jgi:hypothetical protein
MLRPRTPQRPDPGERRREPVPRRAARRRGQMTGR